MAGHSHWNNIKHKKSAQDKKKAALIQKYAYKIKQSILHQGKNLNQNLMLKNLIKQAKNLGVPNTVIEKAMGQKKEDTKISEVFYEIFFPGGLAVILKGESPNSSTTSIQLKEILNKTKGKLCSCAHLFQEKHSITVDLNENCLIENYGHLISDYSKQANNYIVECSPENFFKLLDSMDDSKLIDSEHTYIPIKTLKIQPSKNLDKFFDLISRLSFVQDIYTNFEII